MDENNFNQQNGMDNGYNQPYQTQYNNVQQPMQNEKLYPPLSMGDWFIIYLLQMIPCVNIVMLFIWAFSSETNPSKKNYARVILIITGIAIVLYIVAIIVVAMAGITIGNSMYNSY